MTVAYIAARRSGETARAERAMDAAEAHRRHIHDRFYDLPHAMHRALGEMYVSDERFAKTYEDREPGLATYVRDAVCAIVDRQYPWAMSGVPGPAAGPERGLRALRDVRTPAAAWVPTRALAGAPAEGPDLAPIPQAGRVR